MRVQVSSALPQRTGRPEAVFDLGTGPPSTTIEQYALAGDRVLVLRQAKDSPRETVAIVSNWTSLLPAASTPAEESGAPHTRRDPMPASYASAALIFARWW